MELNEIKAQVRSKSGKGPARQLRKEGFIPAIFYGSKTESMRLAVKTSVLMKLMREKEENVFIKLLISGEKDIEKLSMIRDIQTDPLTGRFVHADFIEISMSDTITFDIPIHFAGIPVGVDDGGELHHMKRDLKVSCLPGILPDFIEVDVSGLRIGDSIKVQNLNLRDGITVLDPEEATIAAVAATKVVRVAETAEEAETGAPAAAKE